MAKVIITFEADSSEQNFFEALSKLLKVEAAKLPESPKAPEQEPTQASQPKTPAKPKEKTPTSKTVSEPSKQPESPKAPESEEVEEEVEEIEEESSETPEPETEITIEKVRALLAEKVSDHREEIRTKLLSLGSPNVTNLDPAKYKEFSDYLNSLS